MHFMPGMVISWPTFYGASDMKLPLHGVEDVSHNSGEMKHVYWYRKNNLLLQLRRQNDSKNRVKNSAWFFIVSRKRYYEGKNE